MIIAKTVKTPLSNRLLLYLFLFRQLKHICLIDYYHLGSSDNFVQKIINDQTFRMNLSNLLLLSLRQLNPSDIVLLHQLWLSFVQLSVTDTHLTEFCLKAGPSAQPHLSNQRQIVQYPGYHGYQVSSTLSASQFVVGSVQQFVGKNKFMIFVKKNW